MHAFENVTLGKENDPIFNSVLSDMYYIVLDTTGILLTSKSVTKDKYIIEANNLRAIECSFYIASKTHELDDALIESGDEEYKNIYREAIVDLLYDVGLDNLDMDEQWYQDDDGMHVYLEFSLKQERVDLCMTRIGEFVKKELKWTNDEVESN
jgi:hypothetical protein